MNRKIAFVAVAALSACATTPQRYQPRALRAPAEELFAVVDQPSAGLSMLVDMEAMREQGLIPAPPAETAAAAPGQPRQAALVDLYVAMLPAMMATAESDTERATLAKIAVYWTLLDRWAVWPHVQRFGLKVPMSADTEPTMERILDTAFLVLAVDQDEARNRELLRGFAALGRSFRASLAPSPAALDLPPMDIDKGELCIAVPELPQQICLHGGEGFYALGTQNALRVALAAKPVEDQEEIVARNDLFHMRFEAAQLGTTSVRLSGRGTLKLVANLDKAAPPFVTKLETELKALVERWDASTATTRTLVSGEVDKLKGNMAADSKASPAIKTTALSLSPESVLDPEGHSAAMRRSLKIERGERSLHVEMGFSEELVKKLTTGVGNTSGASVVATVGVLSAIAIPNFVKYQCRSKQSEAKAQLGALMQGQMIFRQEKGGWAPSFSEAGFSPEIGNRYTYCMSGQCLACTRDGCEVQGPNPCSIYQAAAGDFLVCAYANLKGGSEALDVWLMDSRGQPEQLSDDCSN